MAKFPPPPVAAPFGRRLDAFVRARFPLLYVVSAEEERALCLLEGIAVAQRKRCYRWTETRGLENVAFPGEPDEALRDPELLLDAIIGAEEEAIFCLLDFHAFIEGHLVRRKLRDAARALAASRKTIVLLSPRLVLPAELAKEVTVLDAPLPTRLELGALLEARARDLADGRCGTISLVPREREELLRAAQGMTLGEFENVLALALVERGSIDAAAIPLVLVEKEQIVRKSFVLEFVRWERELTDVGGLDLLKGFLSARREAFSDGARAFGLPAPKGICLIGVQGCGKSLTAKAVARFYGLPLLRMDMGRVFAGLVGQSEENVRAAVKLAESIAPCVLWIDEIEKAFSGLGSSNLSDAGTTARVISFMTTWLQEREGEVYVVATANDISQMPPELLRKGRFDEVFFIDLPGATERREIFAIHLRRRGREPDEFDLDALATRTRGFSGAEIEEAIIAGLHEAFGARRPLHTDDIAAAIAATIPLSRTMAERVQGLRAWAEGRARPASSAALRSPRCDLRRPGILDDDVLGYS